jgi:large subunit ribosomal protein L21
MYAFVEINGKQYKVEQDSVLKVEHFHSDEGAEVEFPHVLLVRTEKETTLGKPYVPGVSVKATVEEHGRNPKVVVFKNKRRKNYRRTRGHRQHFTLVRVREIAGVA